MQKNMGKVSAGVSIRQLKKGIILSLCTVMICCAILAFTAIGGSSKRYSVAKAVDVGSLTAADAAELKNLYSAIGGVTTYTDLKTAVDGLSDKKLSSAQLGANNGGDTQVTLGGLKWDLVYVSETTSGDVIATLWLAETEEKVSFANNWYANNTDYKYPGDMYGTSFVRSYLNGSPYAADASFTTLTAGNANATWKNFTDSYGDYISSPSQVGWQVAQFGKDKWGVDLTNDCAGAQSDLSFYSDANINKDYTQKEHYFDWAGDKLWLPSLTETGRTENSIVGIWQLTSAQQNNRVGDYTLLRSASRSSADSTYGLTAIGRSSIIKTDVPMFVRPAFNLNLRAVAQAIGDEVLVPDVTPEAQGAEGQRDGLTYNGAMQAAVQFNPAQAELYSASWTDENGVKQSISAGQTADWLETNGGRLSAMHAGDYTVQFKLASGVATWSDGSTDVKTVTFKLNRLKLNINWSLNGASGTESAGYYWVYDGIEHGFDAALSSNQSIDIAGEGVTVLYSASASAGWGPDKPLTAGKYTVRASLSTENNDYYIDSERTFEIRKRAVSVNWVADGAMNTETNGLHWIYDGNVHTLSAELSGVAAADDSAENLSLSVGFAAKGAGAVLSDVVSGLQPESAGSYTAFATLSGTSKNNYYIINHSGEQIESASQVYKITRREVSVNWAKNPENGTYKWVYSGYKDKTTFNPGIEMQADSSTGDTGVIDGTTLSVNVTYATVTDGVVGAYDDTARVNAGIYKAQATINDSNYVLVNAVLDYEITKLQVKVTWDGPGAYGSDGDIKLWRYDGATHSPTALAIVPQIGEGSVMGGDDITSQIVVNGGESEVTSLSQYSSRGYYEAVASFKPNASENSRNNYELINATQKFRIDKGLVTSVSWYRPDSESESGKTEISESPSFLWGDVKGKAGPEFTAEAVATVKAENGSSKKVNFVLTVTYTGANYADGESWPINDRSGYTATAALSGQSTDGTENANRFELRLKADNGEIVSCDSVTFYILPKAGDMEEITVTWVVFTDGNNFVELSALLNDADGAALNAGGHVSAEDNKFSFVYNGKPQSPTPIYKYKEIDEDGVEREKYELLSLGDDSKKTNAGEWTAYLKPHAKYRYKSGTNECVYTIAPLTLKLEWGTLVYEYDGKEHVPAPKISTSYMADKAWYQSLVSSMQQSGGELSKITANSATDAGEYIVKPDLGANFAYADGTGEMKLTITQFEIVASSVVWTFDGAKNDTMGSDGNVTDDDAWYWIFDGNANAPVPSLTVSLDGVNNIVLKLRTAGATADVGEHYAFAWLDTSDPLNKNFKLIESKDNPVQTQARRKFTIARVEINVIYWTGVEVTAGDGYTGATVEIDGVTYQLSENGATKLIHVFDGTVWSPKAYYKVGENFTALPVEGGMRNVGDYVARIVGEYNFRGADGKPLSRECPFKLTPYEITVTWQQSADGGVLKLEYTGTKQHPAVELSDGIDGEPVTYTVTGYTDAGNYTSEIAFTNPNYTYAGKAGVANVCNYIITKKSISVVWSYSGNAGINGEGAAAVPFWQYNAAAPDITVASVNSSADLTINMPDFGDVTFTFGYTGLSSVVGTHTAKAVISGVTLDGASIDTVNFEINAASNAFNYEITVYEVAVNWTGNPADGGKFEWTYDGAEHAPTAEYLLWDGNWHTDASVDRKRTSAGSYTARLIMPDSLAGNCTFKMVDGRSVAECDFIINKAKVTVNWTFDEATYNATDKVWELEYDGLMHAPRAFDANTLQELPVTGAVADAGNRHIASAALPDANYEFATSDDNFCYFTINVKTVWIKWLDDSGDSTPAFSWYYTPNVERAPKAILANDDGSEFLIDGNRVYAIVSGGATHAGEYLATAEIVSSNYAFPAGETFTQKFWILKLALTDLNFWWTDADKLKDGWYCYEFNGQSQHPIAETRNFTEFSYAFTVVDDEKNPVGSAINGITEEGTYQITIQIVNNNDYSIPAGKDTVFVKISPKTVDVVWQTTPLVYNGANQKPEAHYLDVYGNVFPLTVDVTELIHKDAGTTYHATAKFTETVVKNYVLNTDTSEHEYEIAPRSLTVVWGVHDFYYDNAGHFVTSEVDISNAIITDFIDFDTGLPVMGISYVILDKNGDVIKDENGDPVQSVINAGEYKMVLSLTGPDSVTKNYGLNDTDDSDNQQTFVINKSILVVTADDKEVKYGDPAPVFTATYGEVTHVEGVEVIIHTLIGAEEADIAGLIVGGKRPWLNSSYVPGCVPNDVGYDIKIDIAMLSALLPNYSFVDADGNSTCHIGKLYVTASETTVIWYGDPLVGDPNFEYDGTEHKPEAYLYQNPDALNVIYVDENGDELTDFKAINSGTYYVKAVAPLGVEITERQMISYEIKPREILINVMRVEVTYGDRQVSADGSDILTEDELKTLWEYATEKHAVAGEDLGIYFVWNVADSIKNGYLNSGVYYLEGKYSGDPNYNVIFEGVDNDDAAPDKKQYGLYVVNNAEIIDESKQGTEWFYEERVIEKYEQYFIRIEDKETDDETGEEYYKYIKFAGDQSATASFAYSTPYLVGRDEIPEPDENENYPNTDQNHTGIAGKGVWMINYRIEIPNHNTYYGRWTVLIKLADEYVIVIFVKPYEIQYGDDVPENLTEVLVDEGYVEISGAITDKEYFKEVAEAYVPLGYNKYVTNRTKVGTYNPCFRLDQEIINNDELDVIYRDNNRDEDSNIDKYVIIPRQIHVVWGQTEFTYDKELHVPLPILSHWIDDQLFVLDGLENGKAYEVTDAGTTVTVTVTTEGNFRSSGGHRVVLTISDPNYAIAASDAVQVISIKGTFPWWLVFLLGALTATALITFITLITKLRHRNQTIAAGITDREGFYDPIGYYDDAGFGDPYYGDDAGFGDQATIGQDGFDYDAMWNDYLN